MNIISPMATGNGAYVVHKMLEAGIAGYKVLPYHPLWTMLPPLLPFLAGTAGADLVHTTPDYGRLFHRSTRPLIVSFQNYVLDSFMVPFSTLAQRLHYATDLRWLTLAAVKRASSVTAVSCFTASVVKRDLPYDGDIRVIYNGVDTNKFTPAEGNRRDRRITVLFSGNLTARKGAPLLPPDIANRLGRGLRLLCTQGLRRKGRLPKTPRLEGLGGVPHSRMPELLRTVDMLLMPTVREGLSLAVLEAMASGLPVVASNISSLPEQIVDGKGGFLCEIGNAADFAEKINILADSPVLRADMGQFNRERAKELFSHDLMIGQYTTLFDEFRSWRS
jgi:glycosyltransferase involved in cell wall biosynthesis